MRSIIDYDRESIKIANLEALPRGLGCSMLLVIESPYPGEYVAKRWLRKMPRTTARGEHVIRL
jgi:hypothetical protein